MEQRPFDDEYPHAEYHKPQITYDTREELRKNDVNFGQKMEHKLYKEYLKPRYPNCVWNSIFYKYAKFDFTNGLNVYELKSRRYYKKRFEKDGYMCEKSKIDWLYANPDVKGKIYFMFYDGLYVYNVSKDTEREGIQIRHGGRTDRGEDERKDQAYIKNEYLKLVSKKICVPLPPSESDVCLID